MKTSRRNFLIGAAAMMVSAPALIKLRPAKTTSTITAPIAEGELKPGDYIEVDFGDSRLVRVVSVTPGRSIQVEAA